MNDDLIRNIDSCVGLDYNRYDGSGRVSIYGKDGEINYKLTSIDMWHEIVGNWIAVIK